MPVFYNPTTGTVHLFEDCPGYTNAAFPFRLASAPRTPNAKVCARCARREVDALIESPCACDHCREQGSCFGCDSGLCP